MNWLIGSIFLSTELEKLVKEIKEQGHNVKFQDNAANYDEESLEKLFDRDSCTVCYGSIAVSKIAKTVWNPGAFLDLDKFTCSNYYTHFSEFLLNRDYQLWYFSNLINNHFELVELLNSDKWFIKPDDFKLFSGKVVDSKDINSIAAWCHHYGTKSSDILLIAPVQQLLREWRVVVADGKVIAGSQYKNRGEIEHSFDCPKEVWSFAEKVLDHCSYRPERVWVMDIAETAIQNLAVVEINAFSSSGLYCCDKEPIVREVSRISLEENENDR